MVTALELIKAAADEVTEYDEGVTTSDGNALGTTVIWSEWVNSALDSSEFTEYWLLIEDGPCMGEVGQIKSLNRDAGVVTVGDPFTTKILSGTSFSIYRLIPPLRRGGRLAGWLQYANQGLRRLWVPDTISIAGVTGQQHYAVDTAVWPWFTSKDRIAYIEHPVTVADAIPTRMASTSWGWRQDGTIRNIILGSGVQTGQAFTIGLRRPAYSLLRKDGTAYAVLSGSTVGSLVIRTRGYYTVVPTVTLVGGGGSGATATATLTGGRITALTVTAPGTGYTSAPKVAISAGTWRESTSQLDGLEALTDECLIDLDDGVTMMKAMGYAHLSKLEAPEETIQQWKVESANWTRIAKGLQHASVPMDEDAGVVDLRPTTIGYPGGGMVVSKGWI